MDMWVHYVFRELLRRRRQAAAVSAGLAIAVAVVVVLSAISVGLKSAQSAALASLYGVGTSVTVTTPAQAGQNPAPQFSFSGNTGSTGSTTTLAQSQLTLARGLAPVAADELVTASRLPKVAAAEGALLLTNYDFSGLIPTLTGQAPPGDGGVAAPPENTAGGGSTFNVDSFSVAGIDPSHTGGIAASFTVTSGRLFGAADAGHQVALVDAQYAAENQITVGASINIGGVDVPVIGLVAAPNGRSSIAQTYLPIDVAQTLSGQPGKITTLYLSTSSAADISSVTRAVEAALSGAHVATQADLAAKMTGSLASAGAVSASIGIWLSLIALAAAAALAALLTAVGVARRSREFGTLKALGWRSRQVVSQVAGESLAQGVIGALGGLTLAGIAIMVTNAVAPELTAVTADGGASAQISLHLGLPLDAALLGAGLSVAAALVAAMVGAFRVAGLRPSESLRSDQ